MRSIFAFAELNGVKYPFFHLHSRLVASLFPYFHALVRCVFLKFGAGAQARQLSRLMPSCILLFFFCYRPRILFFPYNLSTMLYISLTAKFIYHIISHVKIVSSSKFLFTLRPITISVYTGEIPVPGRFGIKSSF